MKSRWMTALMMALLFGGMSAWGQATNAAGMGKEDEQFVKKAQEGGLLEVEAGRLAGQKATSPEVMSFGQQMVTDHSKANERLKQIVQQKGLPMVTELNEKHRELMQKLSEKTGAEFDRAYMEEMVKDHKKDVEEYSKASKEAKDPDLRAFAAETLPILQLHLQMATDIHERMGKGKETPGQ